MGFSFYTIHLLRVYGGLDLIYNPTHAPDDKITI